LLLARSSSRTSDSSSPLKIAPSAEIGAKAPWLANHHIPRLLRNISRNASPYQPESQRRDDQ